MVIFMLGKDTVRVKVELGLGSVLVYGSVVELGLY